MKKILIPLDFSKNAENAAEYAAMLARHIPSSLHFLHIYTVPLISEYNLPADVEKFIEQNRIDAQEALTKFEQDFLKKHPLLMGKVYVHLDYGFISDKIMDYTEKINADLIVMGTKGAGNMLDKMVGTNAYKVMKNAQIPVWVIPPMKEIAYPEWVLYAADYSNDEVDAIKHLIKYLKPLNMHCRVLHVHDRVELNVGHQIEAMASYLEDAMAGEDVDIQNINRDSVIEGLEKYIKTHKPDILALSKHHKSFLEKLFESSVTKHFVYTSHIPLLIFNK